jgi:hypothetical protein
MGGLQEDQNTFLIIFFEGVHAKCPIFLSDHNKLSSVLTDFNKSLKYRISRKFLQ